MRVCVVSRILSRIADSARWAGKIRTRYLDTSLATCPLLPSLPIRQWHEVERCEPVAVRNLRPVKHCSGHLLARVHPAGRASLRCPRPRALPTTRDSIAPPGTRYRLPPARLTFARLIAAFSKFLQIPGFWLLLHPFWLLMLRHRLPPHERAAMHSEMEIE